jgi:hypothetical protein
MTVTFLNTYRHFPVQRPPELERVLVQTYTDIATQVNVKENAQYEQFATIDGQQFYNLTDPKTKRFVEEVHRAGGHRARNYRQHPAQHPLDC